MSGRLVVPAGLALLLLAGFMGRRQSFVGAPVAAQSRPGVRAPVFEVDPFWPRPLPNHWVLGSTIGLAVDARDHVFILHRQGSVDDNFKAAAMNPPIGACCTPAPHVLDMTFSRDPEERYLYVADGVNEKIRIVDRSTLEVLTSFGDGGRQPGQFYGVDNLATDTKGNLYTTETYNGARLQRFIFKGERPVTKAEQGVPWPRR